MRFVIVSILCCSTFMIGCLLTEMNKIMLIGVKPPPVVVNGCAVT